jgi:hypothetical protein
MINKSFLTRPHTSNISGVKPKFSQKKIGDAQTDNDLRKQQNFVSLSPTTASPDYLQKA